MSKRDFTVIKKIGSGSFSNVQKVRRIEDDQMYALKEINFNSIKSQDRQSALNEIRLLASLKSEYLVKYQDAFQDDRTRTLNVIMEFCEKGDLCSVLKTHTAKRNTMPEEDIWNVVKCVIKGLRDLHTMKVFHRDIKCANLFVDRDDVIKIGDLNVSKLQKSGLARTQTGTPYYCPPEIWAEKAYDGKCDIWSFGIVVQELCTGKPPFDGASMQALQNNISKGKQKAIPATYSRELSNLIAKMLKLKPAERPSAQVILDSHIVDYSRTMVRRNSDPCLLKTIVCPRDMLKLKAMLPERRQQNHINHDLPSLNKNPALINQPNPKLVNLINENVKLKDNKIELVKERGADDANKNKENKNAANIVANARNANMPQKDPKRPQSKQQPNPLVHDRLQNRRPNSREENKREVLAILEKAKGNQKSPRRNIYGRAM